MREYKTVIDNKKAVRQFNYCIAKYRGKVTSGKVKSFILASTRNTINQIELDTKSIFKFIDPRCFDSVELIQKEGKKFISKITLEGRA